MHRRKGRTSLLALAQNFGLLAYMYIFDIADIIHGIVLIYANGVDIAPPKPFLERPI